jgi:pantoate--beta-alanine ligase
MIIFKHIIDINSYRDSLQKMGQVTGFVPTMGALHAGHLSLIAEARAACDVVVSSVFVNPTQFNDPADFEKYPVTIEHDIDMLEKAGCDVLFVPSVAEMYPEGLTAGKQFELGYLEKILDGAYRPGHFQGVCRVMEKLLTVLHPDKLFLGQKDYQQCMVLQKLVKLMGMDTTIHICATQREVDGLAMSSRNVRLSAAARQKAPLIFQALTAIKQNIPFANPGDLKTGAALYLTTQGFKVDYVEIADATTLQPAESWNKQTPLVALAAAFIDGVRLIDNLLLVDEIAKL